jgi:hypothetical protein
MLELIPRDVWAAGAISVGVELSAIRHHVGSAMIVAIMFGLCALVAVQTINDALG